MTWKAWRGVGSIDVTQRDTQEWLAAVGHGARLDELIGNAPGGVDRYCKAQSLSGDALWRCDERRDADDLTVDVQEWSARRPSAW